MGKVINKTTLQIIDSVNTPDYSSQDWLINPDLSNVQGVAEKYWKIVNDEVVEMDQSEKDAVDAAELAAYKKAKNLIIDAKTKELIESGITYNNTLFSSSETAQNNWLAMDQLREELTYPFAVTTYDDDEYEFQNADELHTFVLVGFGTIEPHYSSGRSLKMQVNAASNIAEVDAVQDNR